MGQAKRRGSYKERFKKAQDRDAEIRQKANEEYWKRREEEALKNHSLIGIPSSKKGLL